jgi:hypothetical protein
MPSSPAIRWFPFSLSAALFLWAGRFRGAQPPARNYAQEARDRCQQAEKAWQQAGSPAEDSPTGDALVVAAIFADRPDLVDTVLTHEPTYQGPISIPRGGRTVPLHILHGFTTFTSDLQSEMFASIEYPETGWLARRITPDAIEVWTPKHGWLFSGDGRLFHQATVHRGTGFGRQWYGAFLPDGRWVTTDLQDTDVHLPDTDGRLTFFSAKGRRQRSLSCEELAPSDGKYADLIGWARSDREGQGWVVNVGSEEGRATVWIGPTGPARILKPGERWGLCYPRALGPRMTTFLLTLGVPDDQSQWELSQNNTGHGPGVGFPEYERESFPASRHWDDSRRSGHVIPGGNNVFGFWPGKSSYFIGAEEYRDPPNANVHTRKRFDRLDSSVVAIIDKTWFFDSADKLLASLRARRIGDAADGRSMLFRVTADSRILTLSPDLQVKAMRRFVWHDHSTADAVALWDDLRLGLFIRNERLILASWNRDH